MHCRKCLLNLESGSAISLWDDCCYCTSCLEAACPGLAAYALANGSLADSYPFKLSMFARSVFWFWCISCLLTPCCCIIPAIVQEHPPGWRLPEIVASVIVLTIFSSGIWAIIYGMRFLIGGALAFARRPDVHVRHGLVTMTWHGTWFRRTFTCPISMCSWTRVGSLDNLLEHDLRHGTVVDSYAIANLQELDRQWTGVVLWKPDGPRERGLIRGRGVPCGSSQPMVEIWQGFLRLAGVPEQPL